MRHRQLGNPTDKAWLAGWDKGILGGVAHQNPYRRRPQREAWERGRQAGFRSSNEDVRVLSLRMARAGSSALAATERPR